MNALKNGKHIVAEIEGQRCTVVDSGITEDRMAFLKELLELNKFTVRVATENVEAENQPKSFIIGVTDLLFNPVIAVYDCSLRTKDGKIVTPAYWNQKPPIVDSRYWVIRKKADNQE